MEGMKVLLNYKTLDNNSDVITSNNMVKIPHKSSDNKQITGNIVDFCYTYDIVNLF